jgi:nicotinamidase-related amidase
MACAQRYSNKEERLEMVTETAKNLVLMDVDTQEDFMLPHGAFGKLGRIANVGRIIPNLKRVFDYAAARKITTLLATDAHVPDDPEFSTYGFPAHCVLGTQGHLRIPETDVAPTLVVPNAPDAFLPPIPDSERPVIMVHKQHFAVGTNPNFAAVVRALGPCHVFATGVATQGCVRKSIDSLLSLGVSVSIVVDAVGPDIHEETGRAAIEEMKTQGVTAYTAEEVCSGVLEQHLD